MDGLKKEAFDAFECRIHAKSTHREVHKNDDFIVRFELDTVLDR